MTRNQLLALASLPLLAACQNPDTVTDASADKSSAPIEDISGAVQELPTEITALLDAEYSEFEGLTYYSGSIDLNGDGSNEWIAFVAGPSVCGTGGCPLRVFQETPNGVETKGQLSVVQLPVGVFETSTDGWRDLAVTIGGGGVEYSVVKVPYSDPAYASNPTVAPAERSSDEFTTVIAIPEM